MALFKRRPRYEDPVESAPVEADEPEAPPESTLDAKERRRLERLRKKAANAARKADQEAEKARLAAQRVREASSGATAGRDTAAGREEDVPEDMAGSDRAQVLTKREARKLKRLRRKAQKS